jgi:hypothetical protein
VASQDDEGEIGQHPGPIKRFGDAIELVGKQLEAVYPVCCGPHRQHAIHLRLRIVGVVGVVEHPPSGRIEIFERVSEHAAAGQVLAQKRAAAASAGA